MSSINPNNIDGTYPIAGQDNDSQGFRDNFTNIKNNFTFAASELAELQQNSILKSALSGTTLNNNLNNAQLIGAQISRFTETRNDLGSQNGPITVNWSDAHFQTLSITGNTIVTLSNWPTSGFWTKLVLDVTPTADNLGFKIPTAINQQYIKGFDGNAITLPTGNVTYRFEFSTYDGGTTLEVRDLLRDYNSRPFYQISAPTSNVAVSGIVGAERLLLTPTGTVISFGANVTLPNTTVDGTTFKISSNVATQLAVTPSWSSSISPYGNVSLTAGTSVEYMYNSSQNTWFKVS